jgi:radical SAM protein with 4Fe4S-binding SPASM domain
MGSEIKPSYGLERIKLNEAVPLTTPFTVFLSVATVCNFKCKYCIHSIGKAALAQKGFFPEIMSWEIFLEAAQQIKQFKTKLKTLFLYGVGEPMCNKRLPEMVAYLKKLDVAEEIAFITNGSLLTRESSLALIDAGLDTLRISLQGMSSEKYFEICDYRINFEELVDNIRFYYENKGNANLYVKIPDVALDNGDEERFYQTFKPISDRMFVEKIVPVFHEIDYSSMIKSTSTTDLWGNIHDVRMVCPICFYTLTVLPNGDVYPCCMESDPAGLGNIKDTSLPAIWNGEKHLNFLKLHLEKKRMSNDICKHCTAPDTSAKLEDELDSCAGDILSRI